MKKNTLVFVHFEPHGRHFRAFLPIEAFIMNNLNGTKMIDAAANLYEKYTNAMLIKLNEIDYMRRKRILIPARLIWELGDLVFKLVDELKQMSLQIDSLYQHLSRDLNIKPKRLEKIVIFRRYINDEKLIPPALNWGRCEKGTRRIAENISRGILPG